jgi:5-methylcytosine-specific restriction endonuclease McrA
MANPIVDKTVYKTKRWQKCRAAYMALRMSIDGALCEICGQVPGEIVHHVEELTPENCTDPNVAYNFENFQLACWACHERTKSHNGIPIRADIRFDENGNVVPTGKKIARV